jgi:hypothetical protein
MNIIEFLFKLVEQFVPMDPTRIRQLEEQGKTWYKSIESKETPDNQIEEYVIKYGSEWWFSLGLAILFIFAHRWIYDYMNPVQDDERLQTYR